MAWIRKVLGKCRAIVKMVKFHQAVFAEYTMVCGGKMLNIPAQTRFGGNYILAEEVIQNKDALEKLVASDKFKVCTGRSRAQAFAGTTKPPISY